MDNNQSKLLTSFSKYCGCSAKYDPLVLNNILNKIRQNQNPSVLVGFDKNDDAGVYLLNQDNALVSTVDIIVPPVDDPYLFGEIAASNALSDIYAMGGKPLFCLNIVCFPENIKPQVLENILKGSLDKIKESGAVLIGGHTIKSNTPHYGLAVTGVVHPQKYWSNGKAMENDRIILTKPIGSGILFTANRKNVIKESTFNECTKYAKTLNKYAAQVMTNYEIHAVTDITGFGLAGHMFEMAKASKVSFEIDSSKIPVLPEALEMYKLGFSTSITSSNLELIWSNITINKDLPKEFISLLGDPQTNGGLLISVPFEQASPLVNDLNSLTLSNSEIIGKVSALKNKLLKFN